MKNEIQHKENEMADGKVEAGKVTGYTLAGVYLQLEDLDRLLSDQAIGMVSRLAQGIINVRAMKADVRKRIEEGRKAEEAQVQS